MPKVRSESNGLYERMCLLETGIYSVFWNDILERVKATSRKLQDPKLDLNAAVAMVVSLKWFVEAKRETFTEYERHGATLSGTSDYVQTRQRPRNVRFDYGPASDAELTPCQKFCVTSYIPVIDQFVASLAHRLSAFEELCSRFGFFGKLDSLSPVEIECSADNLVIVYKDDLEQCFGNELVQFVAFSNEFLKDADDNIGKEHFLYKLIIDMLVKCSFPNVESALRMLFLMVTNCSGERSFSKLKYIKNRLRTIMTNERVTHLSLMSIEYDILRETDFDDLITDFAQRKGRKVYGL